MRKLDKPTDKAGEPFLAEEVYDLCISRVEEITLRTQLGSIRELVKAAARNYDVKAAAVDLHLVPRESTVGGVSDDELKKVYSARMAHEEGPGRAVYERILFAPKHRRCPLCNLGTATTLDHHLPKAKYPVLAVTPNNLVPACTWCQKKKRGFPTTKEQQNLHPYFDDVESETWLKARVIEGRPPVFQFFVDAPIHWDPVLVARLAEHIKNLRLDELYGINAGARYSELLEDLSDLLGQGTPDDVKAFLREEAIRAARSFKNSWKAAMFKAGAESDWFCSGGFKHVDE